MKTWKYPCEAGELDSLVKELGDEFLVVYSSPEAVQQRLIHGQNVFRVFDGGRLHVVPYEEWPKSATPASQSAPGKLPRW